MTKLFVLLLGFGLMLGLPLPAFADQVQGLVESVDSSGNSIVVKDPVSGSSKTVRVHPNVAADLKPGAAVKATLKPGSDEAETVEVLMSR